jgi:methylthioribose-1-phosphate isomerase
MLKDSVRAFRWVSSPAKELLILDQLLIPGEEKWIACRNHHDVARCIRDMNVRGAPAIGCVAAYGVALAAFEKRFEDVRKMLAYLESAAKILAATRPTAVNLFWAIERMRGVMHLEAARVEQSAGGTKKVQAALEAEAVRIYFEDLAANRRMGELGAALFPKNAVILTHCNTGSLATSGWGTALGVIRTAYQKGKIKKVLVDETRPYLQGARLTAWELKKDGIPYELITDNMAAHLMKTERVDAAIVGSDRIAANGDVANKIGTYGVAVLCKYHKIPFYVAAPVSTVDLKILSGEQIPIEERSVREVTHVKNIALAPEGTVARHPAFDVTPHGLIAAIITEKGIARPPSKRTIQKLFNGPRS